MRDRMERFVILPFSVGCVSDSSVAVALQQQPHRKSKPVPAAPVPVPADTANSTATSRTIREDEEEGLSGETMKYSLKFLPLPKPDISNGLHRLCKSFKTFSQLFADKEEMESEKDMEIGLPTDVKHVTHIGLDGSTSSSPNSSWESIFSQELFTFPCVPPGLPMETQAAAAASPLVQAST